MKMVKMAKYEIGGIKKEKLSENEIELSLIDLSNIADAMVDRMTDCDAWMDEAEDEEELYMAQKQKEYYRSIANKLMKLLKPY